MVPLYSGNKNFNVIIQPNLRNTNNINFTKYFINNQIVGREFLDRPYFYELGLFNYFHGIKDSVGIKNVNKYFYK